MSLETIVAVDPALRSTGYAVLSRQGMKIACRTYGTIRNKPSLPASSCLLAIRDQLAELILKYEPLQMAVEASSSSRATPPPLPLARPGVRRFWLPRSAACRCTSMLPAG